MIKQYINDSGLNRAGMCRVIKNEEEGKDYILGVFPRTKWVIFKNKTYYDDVETAESGENEYYKHVSFVPKYVIHKNGKKVSMALPRLDVRGKPFLFIPKGITNKPALVRTKRDKYKFALTKPYYIFNIDEEYNINENADIFF
tara:strand:+ start:7132 stop:7560 length:429 start_codon:yes stop_codon:yes gene_type:complete